MRVVKIACGFGHKNCFGAQSIVFVGNSNQFLYLVSIERVNLSATHAFIYEVCIL